jgi:hypothetical protein
LSARINQLIKWFQNYFYSLVNQRCYNFENPWDRIALLALYIERIRDEVYGFIELWNCYVIRDDNTRPNIVSGKPFMMYRRLKSRVRYGQPVDLQLCDALL